MLSYTVTGPTNGRPLLFLHGFLGVKEDWEEVISHLKNNYLCYAFDLPGHGESEYEPKFLEGIVSAFQSLKITDCDLIGYSLGGRAALLLKDLFPNYFKKLIVLGAHPGLTDEGEKKYRWQQDLKWSEMLETQPYDSFLNAWYSQPLFASLKKRPELYKEILEKRSSQNPLHMANILRNFSLAVQPPIAQFYPETLFLYGEDDLKCADLYLKFPKDIKVEKVPACGHILPLENPKGVADKIQTFLKEVR